MKKLAHRIHQFLFRTLNPAGWRIGQLIEELSPDQADALAHLKEEVAEYWKIYHGKRGFGHLANTEPIVRATLAVRDAIRDAAAEHVPVDVIAYHTPRHLHKVSGILRVASA